VCVCVYFVVYSAPPSRALAATTTSHCTHAFSPPAASRMPALMLIRHAHVCSRMLTYAHASRMPALMLRLTPALLLRSAARGARCASSCRRRASSDIWLLRRLSFTALLLALLLYCFTVSRPRRDWSSSSSIGYGCSAAHMSAYASIPEHTRAYVSIREHT
jgi:hypothetical protein